MIDRFINEHRWLSNFALSYIEYEGVIYPTVENAYQAAKCLHHHDRLQFINLTPGQAKKRGRVIELREDWDDVKIGVMRSLLWKKFQYTNLKRSLLATGNEELIEGNAWGDTYWGVCNGAGQNMLGKLLMSVREELRITNG